MYGLPADFDASVFVGRELELICFSANSIFFHFDRKIYVDCRGAFGYFAGSEEKEEGIHSIPVTSSNLMPLLGHCVIKSQADREGTLRLQFDNQQWLVFYDRSPQYEAYHIQIGDKTIIV